MPISFHRLKLIYYPPWQCMAMTLFLITALTPLPFSPSDDFDNAYFTLLGVPNKPLQCLVSVLCPWFALERGPEGPLCTQHQAPPVPISIPLTSSATSLGPYPALPISFRGFASPLGQMVRVRPAP